MDRKRFQLSLKIPKSGNPACTKNFQILETGKKIGRRDKEKNIMAKDKKDLESVTDYVEEKTLDQDKMNAAMGAMAKMKISEKKEDDR